MMMYISPSKSSLEDFLYHLLKQQIFSPFDRDDEGSDDEYAKESKKHLVSK